MSRKYYTKQSMQYGVMFHGRTLPKYSIYGQCITSKGVTPWYCDDLNYYPQGEYIDVHIYDNDRLIWIDKRINRGQIYRDLTAYMDDNGVRIGTECKQSIGYKNTYQYTVARKRKSTALKNGHEKYNKRGEKGSRFTWELVPDTGLIYDTVLPLDKSPIKPPQKREYLNAQCEKVEWVNGKMYPKMK